jgi:ABC-type multidrug transport system fused ATPase/permease subunit
LPKYPTRSFGTRMFEGIARELSIENISYGYNADRLALSDVSFHIPAGAKVALVGSSGSGKSTMAALLMRLREPLAGTIRVDGTDFWEFSPASWHQRLGVVEQEPFLFNETIRANLTFGLKDPTEQQIRNALRIANLEEVVAALPLGIDTPVGERGAQLSGGQRQRLAIARAVARDPRLLILDEATSALDTISELEVQRALDEAMKGRTTLIIAHRLSTVRNSDWIVVMHEGRVVEQGTWANLMDHQGAFAKLVQLNELKG